MVGARRSRRPRSTTCGGQVLTQQFHDIIPGSSIAWVHADAEATSTPRVASSSSGGWRRCSTTLVPDRPHVVNAAAVDRDEVIEVDGEPTRVVGAGATRIVPPRSTRRRPTTTSS